MLLRANKQMGIGRKPVDKLCWCRCPDPLSTVSDGQPRFRFRSSQYLPPTQHDCSVFLCFCPERLHVVWRSPVPNFFPLRETIFPASLPNGGRETWEVLNGGRETWEVLGVQYVKSQSAQAKTCKTAAVPLPNRRIFSLMSVIL
jgi:hypothetical protein